METLNQPGKIAEKAIRYTRAEQETFLVFFFDNQLHLVGRPWVAGIGTLSAALVDPRTIFREAFRRPKVASLVVLHNHPSEYGVPHPSREDLDVTERLRKAGDLLGVDVLDHILLGARERGKGRWFRSLLGGVVGRVG